MPRELFVADRLARRAYADSALPIGDEQTISQPWVVAAICQALELSGDERVLEVGTGSGYSTAILARLAAEVISIERFEGLAAEAARAPRAARLTADRVEVRVGDGSLGRARPGAVRRDRRPRLGPGAAAEPARAARGRRPAGAAGRRAGRRHADRR